MAVLKTDFVDDVLSAEMDGKKRVRLTPLGDGTYIIEDATEYEQVGSSYGQKEINQLNQTVNEKLDAEKVIDSLETAMTVTETRIPIGCLAFVELINKLNGLTLYPCTEAEYEAMESHDANTLYIFIEQEG